MLRVFLGTVLVAGATSKCAVTDMSVLTPAITPCATDPATALTCATTALEGAAVSAGCKDCLAKLDNKLMYAQCVDAGGILPGGTPGVPPPGGTPGGMPDVANMMNKFCDLLPELKGLMECAKPMEALASEQSCKDLEAVFPMDNPMAGIPIPGMGRRLLQDAPDPLAALETMCANPDKPAGRRLLNDADVETTTEAGGMPDMSSLTDEQLDGICVKDGCMSKFFAAFDGSMNCMKTKMPDIFQKLKDAMGDMPGSDMPDMDFDKMVAGLDKGVKMAKTYLQSMCTKGANGKLCVKQFMDIGSKFEDDATEPTAVEMCPLITDMGCCVGSMKKMMMDLGQTETATEVDDTVKKLCNFTALPKSCAEGGKSKVYKKISFKVKGLTAEMLNDDKKLKELKWAMAKDLAKKLGCDESEIEFEDIKPDGTVEIRGTKTDVDADLLKGVELTETALVAGAKLIVDEGVTSSEVTVEGDGVSAEDLTGDGMESPASTAVPSLVAAALVLAAALQ